MKFATILEDGIAYPPRVSRVQYEEAFGRTPRMCGLLDYFEAMRIIKAGGEVADVTCVGDDIENYVLVRKP
jgi:hypothetical protein